MSVLSILRRILGYFPRLAKSAFVRSALLLVALCTIVWYIGPKLRYLDYSPFEPVTNRLIAIVVLVFLWGLYNIRLAILTARTKPKVEPVEEKPRDLVETEIAFLRQSFQNAMQTIRSKWTGAENGNRSLYALPWYLVLGPGPVGKTSLIVDADLKFPLAHVFGQENFKSVRPTGYPQYWVTSEGVLFDLPGAWVEQNIALGSQRTMRTTEQQAALPSSNMADFGRVERLSPIKKPVTREARLWQTFMDLLTEYRPRRPINGVVLCVDVNELVRADDERRANLAAVIHSRLVELAEKLGTRFTIHVLLTKLDLLTGFREYFQNFSKVDRVSPFGFSFTIQNELNTDKWSEEFEAAYKIFVERMNDDLIDKLYEQREQVSRRSIYIFTRELAAIGPIAADFFRHALHGDRFSTPPMVRGIYFASTRQEGVPFNALLARVSREYYMPAPIMPAYSGHSLPYFISELFQRIIFREAGLAGDNKAVERHKRLMLNTTVLASVLALMTFGFYLNEAMRDNVSRADEVLSKSQAFMALPQAQAANAGLAGPLVSIANGDSTTAHAEAADLNPALDAIRAATEEYPDWRTAGEWKHYASLYQGLRVGPKVEEAYLALLKQRYLPALGRTLEDRIATLGNNADTSTGDERFEALRNYILLGDLNKRNEIDTRDNTLNQGKQTIMAWFAKDWQQNHEGDKSLQAGLSTHLWHALDIGHLTAPLNPGLVASAQADLQRVPRDERLYRSIQALAHRQLPTDVSLRNEIGPSFDKIFQQGEENGTNQSDITVSAFYTKKAFLDYFVPRNNDLSVLAIEDAWVAGERQQIAYSPEDLEAFRRKIRQRYSTDYIDAWTQAINGLDLVDLQNVDQAVAVLGDINGPSNPLGRLLSLIKDQSEIYDDKPTEVAKQDAGQIAKAVVAAESDDNHDQGKRITRSFAQLSQIVTANGKDKPYFEELQGALQNLEAYMREIKSGEATNKPIALDKAQARANLAGDDPIYVLRRISANLPQPLNKLLTKIADQCWKVELDAAKKDLQALWQDQVYRQFYVDLATRYPFNRNSKEDVTLDQFTRFFGPKGAFDTFAKDHLVIFINSDTNEPVVIDGRTLDVSVSFVDQLKQVRKIRETFFDANGSPTLRYSLEPLSLSGTAGRSVLNIEGQLVPYSHGPTRPIQILWPNALSSQQNLSQLSVFGTGMNSDTASLTFQGLWSGFRLLDRATVSGVQPDGATLSFSIGNQRALYRMRIAGPENPFVAQPLRKLKLPETL